MVCSPSLEVPTLSATARTPAVESAPVVQFDDTCVVIPDPVTQSRMPRLIKKSYSLPLWRKRSHSNPPPEPEAQLASSPEDRAGMSITVSVPRLVSITLPKRLVSLGLLTTGLAVSQSHVLRRAVNTTTSRSCLVS